jgi:toxin ParE1/3/4
MNFAVKILSPAKVDAVKAALWYDAQVPGLGAEFMAEVNTTAHNLAHDAEVHRVRFADVRRASLRRFKFYGLYYMVRKDEVLVIAVHHGSRHPRWLQERRRKFSE